jgi:hypothetical protein
MQETRPTDNQEPSSKEAADVDAGIASGVEIVSDKLPPPLKEPSESILSSEQQASNIEEQMQETRPTDNYEPSSEEAADIDAGVATVSDKLPPPPKTSGDILSSEHQASNPEEQIQSLDPTKGRWFFNLGRVAEQWENLQIEINGFVSIYVGPYGSGKQLSESEKRSIIAALDGWCPQESWDYLLEHFSADKHIRSSLPSLLTEALLHKHICDYFVGFSNESKPTQTDDFHAPFWNTFGTQMYNLWQSFLQGSTSFPLFSISDLHL